MKPMGTGIIQPLHRCHGATLRGRVPGPGELSEFTGAFSFRLGTARVLPAKFHFTRAICERGIKMANFKYTFLFDWQRRAGWTETFYKPVSGSPSTGANAEFARDFARERAKVLTGSATILAARVSDVETPRAVRVFSLGTKGALGTGIVLDNLQPDVVNVAQLVSFNSTGEERRFYLQRGLDDRDVNDGLIDYASNGVARTNRWLNWLCNNTWSMRDYTKTLQQAVTAIDGAAKAVTVFNGAVYAVGDIVLIQSRTVGDGLKVRWQGRVANVAGNALVLKGYRYGDTAGGFIWKLTATYPDLTSFQMPNPNWARTRQTGRPFNLPRGRAPKRT